MKKNNDVTPILTPEAATKKIYSLLGLSMRGSFVASGEFLAEQKVKEHKAFLVIVAEDASDNTKKNFKDMCNFYHVPIFCFGTKEALGHAIGKELRASLAVTNSGMAEKLIDNINSIDIQRREKDIWQK